MSLFLDYFFFKYPIRTFAISSFFVITFEIAAPKAISIATSYFLPTVKISPKTLVSFAAVILFPMN